MQKKLKREREVKLKKTDVKKTKVRSSTKKMEKNQKGEDWRREKVQKCEVETKVNVQKDVKKFKLEKKGWK